jgi:hypothetical protein
MVAVAELVLVRAVFLAITNYIYTAYDEISDVWRLLEYCSVFVVVHGYGKDNITSNFFPLLSPSDETHLHLCLLSKKLRRLYCTCTQILCLRTFLLVLV